MKALRDIARSTVKVFHSAYVRDPDGNKLAFVYYANAD
ncbi:Lactoylglutathione lyase related lyase [Klebsiella oxytoca]|nr:Lactoylglutathione lyase related lyase [Klebsiella oxytoca]